MACAGRLCSASCWSSESFAGLLQLGHLWAIHDLDETYRLTLQRRMRTFEQYNKLHDAGLVVGVLAGCEHGRYDVFANIPVGVTIEHYARRIMSWQSG